MGKRFDQRGLFEADHLYLDFVGRDTFYGFLASQRGQLFRDEESAALYVLDNGRPSVPPSLLATALLLQTYDRVSDEEAKARADFDIRWKVALGVAIEDRPFAKSTLQVFRAQLILHEKVMAIFKRSLAFARQTGHLKNRKIKAVLDTSNVLGRGAVKDTYNLLADGIVKLIRALASLNGTKPEAWAEESFPEGSRYFGPASIKAQAQINWEDAKAREKFLTSIVADADRLLEIARQTLSAYAPQSDEHRKLTEAAELLAQLLLQDVERPAERGSPDSVGILPIDRDPVFGTSRDDPSRDCGDRSKPEGASIKEGVSRDRVVSVHDPEMRHGRKSKSKRFDGHKAALAVDAESQLITAVAVLAGNAPDNEKALELVEQTEEDAEVEVEETIGDCAFGDGMTRQEFADAGRKLVAKVPDRLNGAQIPKEDFRIDLENKTCTCPAGQICGTLETIGGRKDRNGESREQLGFKFDPEVCAVCPLRPQCVLAGPGKGRTVRLHPQEALLQEARALQHSEAFSPYRQLRQVAEHRIARLVQLGIRQARYFGRVKTLYQLLMAATAANLTLVATKVGLMRGRKSKRNHLFARIFGGVLAFITIFILSMAYNLRLTLVNPARRAGFHPGF